MKIMYRMFLDVACLLQESRSDEIISTFTSRVTMLEARWTLKGHVKRKRFFIQAAYAYSNIKNTFFSLSLWGDTTLWCIQTKGNLCARSSRRISACRRIGIARRSVKDMISWTSMKRCHWRSSYAAEEFVAIGRILVVSRPAIEATKSAWVDPRIENFILFIRTFKHKCLDMSVAIVQTKSIKTCVACVNNVRIG